MTHLEAEELKTWATGQAVKKLYACASSTIHATGPDPYLLFTLRAVDPTPPHLTYSVTYQVPLSLTKEAGVKAYEDNAKKLADKLTRETQKRGAKR